MADGVGLVLPAQFSHCVIQSLFSSCNICFPCSVNTAWMLTTQLLPFQTQGEVTSVHKVVLEPSQDDCLVMVMHSLACTCVHPLLRSAMFTVRWVCSMYVSEQKCWTIKLSKVRQPPIALVKHRLLQQGQENPRSPPEVAWQNPICV